MVTHSFRNNNTPSPLGNRPDEKYHLVWPEPSTYEPRSTDSSDPQVQAASLNHDAPVRCITNRNEPAETAAAVTQGPSKDTPSTGANASPADCMVEPRSLSRSPNHIGWALLSEKARKDLAFAEDVGYDIKVLHKQLTDGTYQVVVLFGEQHSKNTDSYLKAAAEVIKHFTSYAVEGWQAEKYIGGKAYASWLASTRKRECERTGLHNRGAIALTVERAFQVREIANAIIIELAKQASALKSGAQIQPSILKPESFGVSKELFDQALKQAGKLLQDHAKASGANGGGVDTPKAAIRIHHLEQEHRPNWLENFHIVNWAFGKHFIRVATDDRVMNSVLISTGLWLGASILGHFMPTTTGALVQTICGSVTLAYWATLGAMFAFDLTGARFISSKIESMLHRYHHTRREISMTQAIDTAAVVQEPHRQLLVQIGGAHVDPISKRLERDFGWTVSHSEG